jgi:hypothetical protein
MLGVQLEGDATRTRVATGQMSLPRATTSRSPSTSYVWRSEKPYWQRRVSAATIRWNNPALLEAAQGVANR